MASIDEMVCNLSSKHFNKIERLCEPLCIALGINHFFMSETRSDGMFYSIGNNLRMHEYYYLGEKFLLSPFHKDPSSIKPGLYSYRDSKDPNFQHSLDDVSQRTDVEIVICIAVKCNNSLKRFGYGTSQKFGKGKALGLLTSNLPLLKKFNDHFINEMNGVLTNSLENSIDLKTEIGKEYHTCVQSEFPLEIAVEDRLRLLKQMGILPEAETITRREFEYLSYIAQGLTCAQIATSMHLSTRTVENYIENLKNKLRCKCKGDLFRIAQLL